MTDIAEAPKHEYPYQWSFGGDPDADSGYTVIGTGSDGVDVAIESYDSTFGATVRSLEKPPEPELAEGEEVVAQSEWGIVPAMLMPYDKALELSYRLGRLTPYRALLSAPRVVRVENGKVAEEVQ